MTLRRGLVTVVIPAFNAVAFVAQAIESVLSQDHRAIQLILVDDGSPDGTLQVGLTFRDSRLQCLSGPNLGVARARNKGLQFARGEFVAFLDADDFWMPEKITAQLHAFHVNPSLVAVGTRMRYVSTSDASLGTTGQRVTTEERTLVAQALLMPFPLSSTLFRTDVVLRIGGFDESLPGQAEDLDLIARVAELGQIDCVAKVLGGYRIHPASASAQSHQLQRAATRFVRERLSARALGRDLAWDDFIRTYRPSYRQSYGDMVQRWYRTAGLSVAEREWGRAVWYGLLTLLSGPRYALTRVFNQWVRSRT